MSVKPKTARSRARRARRHEERLRRAAESGRLATETRKDTRTGKPFVVGILDGRVVYASKPSDGNGLMTYRRRWLRRTARRLGFSPGEGSAGVFPALRG
jgi:hypothetical protein